MTCLPTVCIAFTEVQERRFTEGVFCLSVTGVLGSTCRFQTIVTCPLLCSTVWELNKPSPWGHGNPNIQSPTPTSYCELKSNTRSPVPLTKGARGAKSPFPSLSPQAAGWQPQPRPRRALTALSLSLSLPLRSEGGRWRRRRAGAGGGRRGAGAAEGVVTQPGPRAAREVRLPRLRACGAGPAGPGSAAAAAAAGGAAARGPGRAMAPAGGA